MAETVTGIRSILSLPKAYEAVQSILGAPKARRVLAGDFIRAQAGDVVVDIGCGTAEIINYLPPVQYVGFDINPAYIESNRKRYAGKGRFDVQTADEPLQVQDADIALALSVMHHLDDAQVRTLLQRAYEALKPGGRLITIDPCLTPKQNSIARTLIKMDRGRNVRTEGSYAGLVKERFPKTRTVVATHLMNIPYTHMIIEAEKPQS